MPIIKFEQVRYNTRKRCKCASCGKAVSRSTTIIKTVNPFNKNADGSIKTRAEVRADCDKEASKWHTKPEWCKDCNEQRSR
jgi:hypothetical protein